MFTTQGARNLLRTVADSGLATHMVLGIGTAAAAASDSRLDVEVLRLPLLTATPDFVNGVIVYRATVPAEQAIDIREVGLVSSPAQTQTLLSDFTEGASFWSGGTSHTSNVRVGATNLLFSTAANGTSTANAPISLTWADADEIVVAYFIGSNVSSATVRFLTDASNYYSYSLPTTGGYQIARIPRASFTATGTPGAINSVTVTASSTAGGSSNVHFDALFYNDTADREPELVVRRVLGANIVKTAGVARDIEYTVTVTAT